MQKIERYGVIALVFLLVTIVAVSFWGDSKSPGFWLRLTGRGAKKDVTTDQASNMIPPASSTERAIDASLPLTANDPGATNGFAAVPGGNEWQQPNSGPGTAATVTNDPWASTPVATQGIGVAPGQHWPSYAVLPPVPEPAPQPQASPRQATQLPATGPQYVVQKGDSLIRIAARTLGSGSRWTEIQALNGGLDPRVLRPGMKLVLPASAKLPKSGSTTAGSPAKRITTSPKPASTSPTGTYVVRAGDTLSAIASRLLGHGDRWREIVAANPGLDPKRLLVGQSIRVPRVGAEGTRTEGVRTAGARTSATRAPVLASAESRSDRPRVR